MRRQSMQHRGPYLRADESGLTAIEVAAASIIVLVAFGVCTWTLAARQRALVMARAVQSPGEVFEIACSFLPNPDESKSLTCQVTNPTKYTLPLEYAANSFFAVREDSTFTTLPITGSPSDRDALTETRFVVHLQPRAAAEFELFLEHPVTRSTWRVVMRPGRLPAKLAPAPTTPILPPSAGGLHAVHVVPTDPWSNFGYSSRDLVSDFIHP